MDRLERLHESLQNLGQRLREGIAHLVGTHIGDAVRDALDALLQSRRLNAVPDQYRDPYRSPEPGYYRHDYSPRENEDEDFWYESEQPPPEEEPEPKPSRWRSLLTGLVQLTSWWLQLPIRRRSWLGFLAVGAAVGVSTLIASPLVGGVVGVIGTAFLMTRLADRATQAAGRVSRCVAR
jgi:hypothetical protein